MNQAYPDDLAKSLERSAFVWIIASMLSSLGANSGYSVSIGIFCLLSVYIRHGRMNLIALGLTVASIFIDILYIGFHAGTLVSLGREYFFAFLLILVTIGTKMTAIYQMIQIHPAVRHQVNVFPFISLVSQTSRYHPIPSQPMDQTKPEKDKQNLKGHRNTTHKSKKSSNPAPSDSSTEAYDASYQSQTNTTDHVIPLRIYDDVEIGDDGYESIVADVKPLLSN